MSDWAKTGIYAAFAVGLSLLAVFSVPGFSEPETFNDTGEQFFSEFTDPTAPTALEVFEFKAETAELTPFKVEFKDGRWSIPSHYGYPADAEDRMAEAAGLLIGLTKDNIVSDRKEDHALYGVIDPNEPEVTETEGRGTLVTFKQGANKELASLIIGKEVETRPESNYVRVPGKNRTYIAKLPAQLTTAFEDWIETDLLDVSSYKIEHLTFDNYSIDEQTLSRVDGERLVLSKEDGNWVLEGATEEEELKTSELSTTTSTLSSLKIVGVRPKPEGLTRDLRAGQGIELTRETAYGLQRRGFFLTRDGNVYANEGDLIASTNEGVEYTLRFGEILFGTGESVSAGSEDEDPATTAPEGSSEDGDEGSDESDEGGANRYLMITARFNAELLGPAPEGTPLAQEDIDKRKDTRRSIEKIVRAVETYVGKNDGNLPESLDALTEGEEPLLAELEKDPWGNSFVLTQLPAEEGEGDDPVRFAVLSYAMDGQEGGTGANVDITSENWEFEDSLQKSLDDHEEYNSKVEEGQATAQKLSDRFAPWYYVIENDSFKKLHLSRADIVEPKEGEEPTDEEGPTLPPGHSADDGHDHSHDHEHGEGDDAQGEGGV